ncbi:HAD superfamily hydrolase [Nitritalea halalkaliphila LW7]|uniref:HAD superfamily hydrolase n=1 Tax=Nitritalea halalkaliphila LW7 TaxID=1189621 RepID=I5BUE6_9BACT|nr:HAD family phosphatase [Nitritalea halalkaliphila]EIM73198.1 HAD superfamily hydrolase [Nitritalea halalkaliphila LW7]
MKQAVIFDMDGVICHTNPYHAEAFRLFFSRYGLKPTEEAFKEHMYGKNNGYIFSYFLNRPIEGEELAELEREKEACFRELYAPHVQAIAGFLPFLNTLRGRVALGVATSAPQANMDLILGTLGIRDYFQVALASEHVRKHKPDPEVYLKAAAALDVSPAEALVFEDSFSGVTAARNAGMEVIGVLSSHRAEELPPCKDYVQNYLQLGLGVLS